MCRTALYILSVPLDRPKHHLALSIALHPSNPKDYITPTFYVGSTGNK